MIFSATPIPGNERAVNETIDRIYHLGADVITTRDAPIHASGHGYAEELKLMLNLTKPRYVMPMHGDHKRLRLHCQLAEAVGVDARRTSSEARTGCRSRSTKKGARFGKREQAGMMFVDGVDVGDIEDVAMRDRRMLSADGIFIVVATVSEQDGRSVAPTRRSSSAASRSSTTARASSTRCATRSMTRWQVGQGGDQRDLAAAGPPARRHGRVRLRPLKRRPMVLPVVVEV